MALLSQRAYARHRGVTLRAVQKAVRSGRIQLTEDGKIDPAQADAEWERNTGPRPHPVIAPSSPSPVRRPAPAEAPRSELGVTGGLDYARARAVHEHYKARKAKLEYEEKLRKLIDSDEVAVAAFNRFRGFRDRMMNIPDQLAPVLAAESDPRRIHEMLATAIRKALLEFADAATQDG
jgi:pyruvate/2-oxoglutarate dehydrogenase complex dihydrolipoamide acyltransferase (E2) component